MDVKELFLRNAGFRSFVREAWANWTSRKLVLGQGSQWSGSFIAKLFDDAIRGNAANANSDPADDVYAECFMQFFDYDWYTLLGKIQKGVAATPGGIAPSFAEFNQSAGCPNPREPSEAFSADPY